VPECKLAHLSSNPVLQATTIMGKFSGLPGLKGDHVCITVGTPEENRRLISALREILS